MEGLHLLKHIIQKGDWMVKIDLKDAYFTVPIDPKHKHFLRFIYGLKRYQFVSPLWLRSGSFDIQIFRYCLRLIIYLDDKILFNHTQEGAQVDRDTTLWLLQNLGFVINWKKSVLTPSQSLEYLGFVIKSLEMSLILPDGKVEQLVQTCRDLIRAGSASVRTLSHVIVHPAPLHYRHLQRLQVEGLLKGQGYEAIVPLNEVCRKDLQRWIDQLTMWNGRSIITPAPDMTITTDASLKGWGEYVRGNTQGVCGL